MKLAVPMWKYMVFAIVPAVLPILIQRQFGIPHDPQARALMPAAFALAYAIGAYFFDRSVRRRREQHSAEDKS